VNWMTAGKGIVHVERIPEAERRGGGRLHLLQAWVALPVDHEETDPSFEHYDKATVPSFDIKGVSVQLIAGQAFGRVSPVKTFSPLFYFVSHLKEGRRLSFDPGKHEAAFYLMSGELLIDGQTVSGPALIHFTPDSAIELLATGDSTGAFLGGEPFKEH